MMTLGACTTFSSVAGGKVADIDLPVLPSDLRQACADPGVRAGHDVRAELARNRYALAACKRKHAGMIDFYDDVRESF